MLALLPERLGSILAILNQSERLGELLRLLDMEDLVGEGDGEPELETYPTGSIVIIGDTAAKPKDLKGVAAALGISKDRLEFVSFDESKTYNYKRLEWNPTVCVVLFSANPHKSTGTHDASSTITYMESHRDMYPRVVRMEANSSLKLTKTGFRLKLEELMADGTLVAD